ncbi:hypothetical protein PQV03_09845 [Thermoanaerobacterium thermosaccharolyticum]|uniref:DUF6978 family protein n=1 Tax=Thermoanaerobacterium thermosaccharolyticum TaxID=1517 RepID=UPI003D2768CE
MLAQATADKLIAMNKKLIDCDFIETPGPNKEITINAISLNGNEDFLFNISRGKIDIRKYKLQNRYNKIDILLRLEIVPYNQFHINPDGNKIYGPHLHYYVEDYGDAWAKPYLKKFTNFSNYIEEFFKLCNVINIPNIQGRCDDEFFT